MEQVVEEYLERERAARNEELARRLKERRTFEELLAELGAWQSDTEGFAA